MIYNEIRQKLSKGEYYYLSYRQRTAGKFCKGLSPAQRGIAQLGRLFLYIFRQHSAEDTLRIVQYGTLRGRLELYTWAQSDDYISSTQITSRQQDRRVSQIRQDSILSYRQPKRRAHADYRYRKRLSVQLKDITFYCHAVLIVI